MDMSGFAVAMNAAGQPSVALVIPGTPAAEAGLQRGDVITAIDDAPVDARAIADLRDRCRRPGERIALAVQRGGQAKTTTVITRRLV
jgi:C-terminal processing protease CtpA/Prc